MDERQTRRHEGPGPLGEILLEADLLTRGQLREALAVQEAEGGRLGHILVDHGFVDERELADALSLQLGVPFFELEGWVLDPMVVRLVPADFCRHHRILPLKAGNGRITLAMADPFNEIARHGVERAAGMPVKAVLATGSAIRRALGEVRRAEEAGADLRQALAARMRAADEGGAETETALSEAV